MNKLRKTPPASPKSPSKFPNGTATSMTLQYAAAAITTTMPRIVHTQTSSRSVVPAREQIMATTDEHQHWVARAIRAEALLAAHVNHREEVRSLGQHQEETRQRELTLVAKEYKEKHQALERLLIFLLGLIAILVILVVYLVTYYVRHSTSSQHNRLPSWWSAVGSSHFTIPILSPFTSVVEHESSIIGPKSIGTLAAISACLVYLIFRYWISSRRTTKFAATSIYSSASNTALTTTSNAIDR